MLSSDSDIFNVDQHRLYLVYKKWPEYFKDAANISCKLDHDAAFYDSVVLCGMGGSATSCDILHDILHLFSHGLFFLLSKGRSHSNSNIWTAWIDIAVVAKVYDGCYSAAGKHTQNT